MENSKERRICSIDFLKGISIIFCIVTHCDWNDDQRLNLFFPFWIEMVVPIFMIISGYLYSLSFEKKHITQIGQAFEHKNLLNKIVRYTIPYLFAISLEMVKLVIIDKVGIVSFLSKVITGGYGPGSYYYPIMIQFIFVFPFVYFIIKNMIFLV